VRILIGFVHGIDAINEWIGRGVAWLTLACVLTCFAVVVLRYAFNIGYPWMQELYVWQHAVVFLLGAGYTLLHRGHVNVDIFYGKASERKKAWLDVFGTLVFLFPWLAVIATVSGPFILSSWAIAENSGTADGMPAVFLLKSAIWVFCALLFLQGLALLVRRALFLAGHTIVDHDQDPITDERI
jgi:TRAP-type mannitol/chloroaromatic compound transport system permease small subunit